jgi:hypothetical protein
LSHSSNVGPGEGGIRAGKQAAVLDELVVGAAGLLTSSIRIGSPHRAASSLANSTSLCSRGPPISAMGRAVGSRHAPRAVGQAGEGFDDTPGGHGPRAHLRHVDHVVLSAPLHDLRDELVKLRRAQNSHRDRPASIACSCATFAAM